MRRFVLLIVSVMMLWQLVLAAMLLTSRRNEVAACLQYLMISAAGTGDDPPEYGVIEANTGKHLIDHGYLQAQPISIQDRYIIAARLQSKDEYAADGTLYQAYDLFLIPLPETRPLTLIPLQAGVLFPIQNASGAPASIYVQVPSNLSTTHGQLAFRWMDRQFNSHVTVMNEDGSNHRIFDLEPSMSSFKPDQWSATANYLLMHDAQAERYPPYVMLDVNTMQLVQLPPALLLPEAANWQTAAWSPTQSQLAAIRPATAEAFADPRRVSDTQLVLYSPSDGAAHLLDLPRNFYAHAIAWSPTGQAGAIIGTYIASDDGRSTQRDYRAYMLFTATGDLHTQILRGVLQPDDYIPQRFGAWSADGRAWLYLSQMDWSSLGNTDYFELSAADADSGVTTVIESRLETQWWSEVFDEPTPYATNPIKPADFKRDLVLVTAGQDRRSNIDLLDTQTMQRVRLVTGTDQLHALADPALNASKSNFRLSLTATAQPSIQLFHALVTKADQLTYVWSGLDGTDHHEVAFDADNFQIVRLLPDPQPTLFYHLTDEKLSTIGKLDLHAGTRLDLLQDLTFLDTGYVIAHDDADRIMFAATNILTGPSDLYLSALDGSFSKRLATQILFGPVWSPTGDQLAYMEAINGRYTVTILDRNGEFVRKLPTSIQSSQSYQSFYLLAWMPCPA